MMKRRSGAQITSLTSGPAAGAHGGEMVAAGTPEEVARNPASVTGLYISGKISIEVPEHRRTANGLSHQCARRASQQS